MKVEKGKEKQDKCAPSDERRWDFPCAHLKMKMRDAEKKKKSE
jgi:hypothetical protein